MRRVRKLKSRDVVLSFDCNCGKLRDKQGVICLKLRIYMISEVKKCADSRCLVGEDAQEPVS